MAGIMPTTLAPVIEVALITSLRLDAFNPRKMGETEMEALCRSIREFGFVSPVVAQKSGRMVIGGHQRLQAARRLGMTSVPTIFVDLPDEQARLLNLALNKISGSWDEALLGRLLADLNAVPDIDLSLSGFGEDEIAKTLRSLDP